MSIKISNVELKYALKEIENAANIKFSYSNLDAILKEKVTLSSSNETLGNILNDLLLPNKLSYELIGRHIILRKTVNKINTNQFNNHLQMAFLQTFSINGKITSSSGEPIVGTTLTILPINKSTIADANGFSLLTIFQTGITH